MLRKKHSCNIYSLVRLNFPKRINNWDGRSLPTANSFLITNLGLLNIPHPHNHLPLNIHRAEYRIAFVQCQRGPATLRPAWIIHGGAPPPSPLSPPFSTAPCCASESAILMWQPRAFRSHRWWIFYALLEHPRLAEAGLLLLLPLTFPRTQFV